jgi:hypothetical protein
MEKQHINVIRSDEFKDRYSQEFSSEVELYFANCSLDDVGKMRVLSLMNAASKFTEDRTAKIITDARHALK